MPSQEGIQTTLGEPGVVIPKNPQEMDVFKTVREVDAKKLNSEIKSKEEGEVASTESKPKYVKKVKKLVSKDEVKAENNNIPQKKEKRSFFGKIKKAIS